MKHSDHDPHPEPGSAGKLHRGPEKVPWYRMAFKEEYLTLYGHRDQDEARQAVAFLHQALRIATDHRLLDLCCGAGRHLRFFQEVAGLAVGLDLSPALLKRAGGMASTLPPRLVQGDMRRLPFADGVFHHVVSLFTSFGYFTDEERNQGALREMSRVLQPSASGKSGGLFAMDHINREALLANLVAESERTLPGGLQVIERRTWEPIGCRIVKDVELTDIAGRTSQWQESVRVYEPDELEGLLLDAGLIPFARFGGYDGQPWTHRSGRLILLARKR